MLAPQEKYQFSHLVVDIQKLPSNIKKCAQDHLRVNKQKWAPSGNNFRYVSVIFGMISSLLIL